MSQLDPRNIAIAMGGDVTGRDSVNVPGPGHSKADRSLAIKINARAPGGFVVFSHCGDDPIECRDYVRHSLGMEAFDPQRGHQAFPQLSVTSVSGEEDIRRRKEFAEGIWRQSSNPIGTIVEKYLRDERGLLLPPTIAGAVVRYHAGLRYGDQSFAGMVCLMRNIVTDEPCGIHRTFLDKDGKKVDRRMLGIAKGAAIKLDAHDTINGPLTIGEGFESSLASKLADLGPAWALGSAGGVKAFPLIERVTSLTVLQENDPTSKQSTRAVTKRYLAGRRPVNVVTPRKGLNDFNDVWREACRS